MARDFHIFLMATRTWYLFPGNKIMIVFPFENNVKEDLFKVIYYSWAVKREGEASKK
jgi:hypothetical protein